MAKPIYSETVRSKRGNKVCIVCWLDSYCHGSNCPKGSIFEDHRVNCTGSYTPKKKLTIIL